MSHIYVMSIMRQHSDRVIFFNFFFVVHDHALNQNVIIIGDIISSVAILLNALLHRIMFCYYVEPLSLLFQIQHSCLSGCGEPNLISIYCS